MCTLEKDGNAICGKLATLLLDQRLKRGVSRSELETCLGVNADVIAKIESLGNCSLADIQRYFNALNLISAN